MKQMIKRILLQLVLLAILMTTAFYAGTRLERARDAKPVAVKEWVRTIAVVNMDQGLNTQNEAVNYGTQLMSFTKDLYMSTSLEDARTGVEKGKYGAYVIIPPTFSQNVWSINTNPQKAILDYAVNPNLSEDALADVIYDLKAFEMKLNTDISYLYLHAILEEFHTGQDAAVTVMKNDKIDTKRLAEIVPEELLQPLAFVELNAITEYPEDLDMKQAYASVTEAADGMGHQFDTYILWAEEDLMELKEDKEPFEEGMENMRIALADLALLEDEQGNSVYADGIQEVKEGFEEYDSTLAEERKKLSDAFLWVGRRDKVASSSNATLEGNTWLDEIGQEQRRQKNAYQEELDAWQAMFDYTMLATASNATPPNASPSNATPSNTEGWLLDRDTDVVMDSLTGIYGNIMTDMEDLCLNDEDLDAIHEVLRRNLQDKETIREEVASASNAHPIEIRPSPEAEEYVKGFLKGMPKQDRSIDDFLDHIGDRMAIFGKEHADKAAAGTQAPIGWFQHTFEQSVVQQIEKQEVYSQEFVRKELDHLDEVFREYNDKLDQYDPLGKTDEAELQGLHSKIGDGVLLMEQMVNDKSDKDRMIMDSQANIMDDNINMLQDSMDQSHQMTGDNLIRVLGDAKKNRADLNQDNEKLLNSFTKKLPYTRNGSVADINSYDFMVNPVETREKKLAGRFEQISLRGMGAGSAVLGALLLAAVIALLGVGTGTAKHRRRSEDGTE